MDNADTSSQKLRAPGDFPVRFVSAVVYLVLTVACLMIHTYSALVMLMVTAGICAHEFYYMLARDARVLNELIGTISAVLYPAVIHFFGLEGALVQTVATLLVLMIWYVFDAKAGIGDFAISFFGALYCGLLLSGIIIIRETLPAPWGAILALGLFASTWLNDVFAYGVGSLFGKHKMCPNISPKKSWEGFAAGMVGSVAAWIGISFIPGVTMVWWLAVICGIICGGMGVLGDLAESRIKRNTGFKDSGTIMPGHGGLLDRCDSIFLASVTGCILLIAFGCVPYVF
ncbi:MAG: phosphatidate cytidylyltransferase [Eggerthellaceae bacterium]|nr:phosphatidate cytidylyltransferase [Eggerthellaceae bacterium]